LDADSEGLLLLSDEKGLNNELLDPKHAHTRKYWAQVEGEPDNTVLERLKNGVVIQGFKTLPCFAKVLVPKPVVTDRNPPVRFRKKVPTSWIELTLEEGKNRQVRRMTAALGFPTLRLIRTEIGRFGLASLAPGEWRELTTMERKLVFDWK
jgi:23S rRNA pseudouridine2457 synthase